jgi:hypothetical protein
MDPDAIFIILLYFSMLVLTIGSILGLSKKIWKTKVSMILKFLVVGLLIFLLTIALVKFNGVESGEVQGRQFYISRWDIMIYAASLLIGLNWSINLSHKPALQTIRLNEYFKITILTILFAIIIPTMFYLLGRFFEKLNLLGSGG